MLLRPVADPWPFPDGTVAVPRLVHALDLLELATEGHAVDPSQARAAWELLAQHAAQDVPSWHRATRPLRAGPESKVAVLASKRTLRPPATAPASDADLLAASRWTPARLQAAADVLLAEPPRGQQVLVDDDRLQLVAARTASRLVERLFTHLESRMTMPLAS
jgi:hypothetical protein